MNGTSRKTAEFLQRLKDGRIFNLFSATLPVLFDNKDKGKTTVEIKVVAAPQAYAVEVSELPRDGTERDIGGEARGALAHQREDGARRNPRDEPRQAA